MHKQKLSTHIAAAARAFSRFIRSAVEKTRAMERSHPSLERKDRQEAIGPDGDKRLPGPYLSNPAFLAYGGLALTMVIWGVVPVFLKKLLNVLTPPELSFSRFLMSGALLLIWALFRMRSQLIRIVREDFKLLLLSTIFGPLAAMVCFNFGILHVTVGTAAVVAAVEPLCTYLLAVIIGQETWQPKRLLSIVFALLGISLVVLARESWGITYWLSLLLITLTPIIWAVNNILTKELIKRHSALVMVATSFVLSSLFLIPTLSHGYLERLATMGTALWLAFSYCVLSTIFGFSIWYWSLRYLPPTTVAVSMYLIPLFSVTAGVLLLGEPLTWMKGAGVLTVLVGLYLVNVRFR
jgi:drug/metabolite transporter (DMT)-like permease